MWSAEPLRPDHALLTLNALGTLYALRASDTLWTLYSLHSLGSHDTLGALELFSHKTLRTLHP